MKKSSRLFVESRLSNLRAHERFAYFHQDRVFDMDEILSIPSHELPDVAEGQAQYSAPLERVGMESIQIPVFLNTWGKVFSSALVKASCFVDLKKVDARGIHMSRLYLALQDHLSEQELDESALKSTLDAFLETHPDLSESAELELNFKLMLQKQALLSSRKAWSSYPVSLKVFKNKTDQMRCFVSFDVTYSSTCPCSAALSRQVIAKKFRDDFSSDTVKDKWSLNDIEQWILKEESICATPHSQRSFAKIDLEFKTASFFSLLEKQILRVEQRLGTAVQTVVKRVDEQKFAQNNAANLMFCEDACRRIRDLYESDEDVLDYKIVVEHQESLHPHNAVAKSVKGLLGGFKA